MVIVRGVAVGKWSRLGIGLSVGVIAGTCFLCLLHEVGLTS